MKPPVTLQQQVELLNVRRQGPKSALAPGNSMNDVIYSEYSCAACCATATVRRQYPTSTQILELVQKYFMLHFSA